MTNMIYQKRTCSEKIATIERFEYPQFSSELKKQKNTAKTHMKGQAKFANLIKRMIKQRQKQN